MLTEQLVCVREHAGTWDYSKMVKMLVPRSHIIHIYIKCAVSQLVKSAMEERHMTEVPGGVDNHVARKDEVAKA